MDRYTNTLDIDSAQGKREFSDVLLPVVRGLSDDVERDHYLNTIAKTIGVSKEALDQKLQKTPSPRAPERKRRVKVEPSKIDASSVENKKTQDNFLSLMLMRQTLREFLQLVTEDMLYTDDGKALLKFLKEHPDFDGKDSKQLETVQKLADYVKIESLLYEELYQPLELNELHYEAARLQARLVERFVNTEKTKLADAMDGADQAKTRELLTKAKKYDELLNQVKGAADG